MQTFNPTQVREILNADTFEDAASLISAYGRGSGISDKHYAKLEFIKAVRGYRAVGGFFNPTIANVSAKAREIWEQGE